MGMDLGTLLFRVAESRGPCPEHRGAEHRPRGSLCCELPARLPRELGAPAGQAVPARPLSPALGKPEQQEKLCSCPGEPEGSLAPPAERAGGCGKVTM